MRRGRRVPVSRRIALFAVVVALVGVVSPQPAGGDAPAWGAPWIATAGVPSGTVGLAWNNYLTTLQNDSGSNTLALHLRFNDNGTLQFTYNKNGYSGYYSGSPTYQQPGGSTAADKSTRFDGNDFAVVNHHNDLSMNYRQPFSVEVVFKPNSFPAGKYPRIFSKMGLSQSPNPGGYELAFNADAKQPYCGYYSGDGAGDTYVGAGGNLLATGQWAHMVCTFDGSNLRFYWNGTLTETKAAAGNITGNNQNIYMGSLGGTQDYADGWFDEASLYHAALDARQVKSHYYAWLAAL